MRATADSSATDATTSSALSGTLGLLPPLRSSSTTTLSPRRARAAVRWEPMKPAPPVTRYFAMVSSSLGLVAGVGPEASGPEDFIGWAAGGPCDRQRVGQPADGQHHD